MAWRPILYVILTTHPRLSARRVWSSSFFMLIAV